MRDFTALTECPYCQKDALFKYTFLQYVAGMVQLWAYCTECKNSGTIWMTAEKYIFFSEGGQNGLSD